MKRLTLAQMTPAERITYYEHKVAQARQAESRLGPDASIDAQLAACARIDAAEGRLEMARFAAIACGLPIR